MVDDPGPIYRRIALGWRDLSEMDSARQYADRALALKRSVENLLMSAELRVRLGDFGENAIAEVREVLSRDSQNHEALGLLAILTGAMDTPDAIKALERVLEIKGDDPILLQQIFQLHQSVNEHVLAAIALRRLLRVAPSPVRFAHLAITLSMAEEEVEAIREFDRLVQTLDGPATNEFIDQLISFYSRETLGDSSRLSDRILTYLLEDHGGRGVPTQILVRGFRLALSTSRTDLLDGLVKLLETRPSLGLDSWRLLAEESIRFRLFEVGAKIAADRIGTDSAWDDALSVTLGKAYFGAGRIEEALEVLGPVVRDQEYWFDADQDGDAWVVYARASAITGDRREALRAFQRAIDLYPENIDIVSPFARFLAEEGIHSAYGLTVVQPVISSTGNDPDLMESYARLALNAGKLELAESVIGVVKEQGILTPFGHETLGSIYLLLGNSSRAVSIWREGLALLESGAYRQDQTIPEAAGRRERTERGLREKIQKSNESE